jgi:FtsP/CotA-like multicopper oxidase with cupredoxin domain
LANDRRIIVALEKERDMAGLEGTGIVETVTYSTFGCNVFKQGPQTPDKVTPNVVIKRRGAETFDLKAPDGKKIRAWGFVDSALPLELQKPSYPSPTIRVRQGQIVHTTLTTAKGPHTIHHHGIEPTTANDGVGHVSFEVNDSYTYQWQPQHAGTFFYHCHRNTVLHFELGMLGLLIVDPPEGPGRLYKNGPAYDVERAWILDDMDPRWHQIGDHDAGLCGMDVGLNRFEPKYFLMSGVFSNYTMTDPKTMITAPLGKRILIRLLNASYSVLHVTLGCDAIWAGCDGHGMATVPWCSDKLIPAGTTIEICTAQRYDLILAPTARGTYSARVEFRHWVTGQIQNNGAGVINTKVVVT